MVKNKKVSVLGCFYAELFYGHLTVAVDKITLYSKLFPDER